MLDVLSSSCMATNGGDHKYIFVSGVTHTVPVVLPRLELGFRFTDNFSYRSPVVCRCFLGYQGPSFAGRGPVTCHHWRHLPDHVANLRPPAEDHPGIPRRGACEPSWKSFQQINNQNSCTAWFIPENTITHSTVIRRTTRTCRPPLFGNLVHKVVFLLASNVPIPGDETHENNDIGKISNLYPAIWETHTSKYFPGVARPL